MQICPGREDLPGPSCVCPGPHCGPALACAHTAGTGRTFNLFRTLLSHHSAWRGMGYGSKRHRVLSICTKTYRPTIKKPLSFKWDTTFQCLSVLPMRKTAISSQSSTTLLHWASATAKLPCHFWSLRCLGSSVAQESNTDTRRTGVSGLHWHPFPPRTLHAKPSEGLVSQARCSQFTVPWRRRVMAQCCSQPLAKDHSYWPTLCS